MLHVEDLLCSAVSRIFFLRLFRAFHRCQPKNTLNRQHPRRLRIFEYPQKQNRICSLLGRKSPNTNIKSTAALACLPIIQQITIVVPPPLRIPSSGESRDRAEGALIRVTALRVLYKWPTSYAKTPLVEGKPWMDIQAASSKRPHGQLNDEILLSSRRRLALISGRKTWILSGSHHADYGSEEEAETREGPTWHHLTLHHYGRGGKARHISQSYLVLLLQRVTLAAALLLDRVLSHQSGSVRPVSVAGNPSRRQRYSPVFIHGRVGGV